MCTHTAATLAQSDLDFPFTIAEVLVKGNLADPRVLAECIAGAELLQRKKAADIGPGRVGKNMPSR